MLRIRRLRIAAALWRFRHPIPMLALVAVVGGAAAPTTAYLRLGPDARLLRAAFLGG